MKTLEYTGLKTDGERAFLELTGIEWMPGAVHQVQDAHAEQMLKHPTIWREVPAKTAKQALQKASPTGSGSDQGANPGSELPAWVKKGVELGATDDQLEAIAQAGGPDTEQGAALWKDAVGTDWKAAEPAASTASKVVAKAVPAKKAAAKKTAKKAK